MRSRYLLLAISLGLAASANAASTDVVFRGGGTFTSTSGCEGWNPAKDFFVGTYWVPVAGSTNGPDSVITFHFGNGTAEGFQRDGDVFTPAFKSVWAVHAYTRIGTYDAFVRVTSRTPATITKNTKGVDLVGAVRGWDRDTNCVANFTMKLVRDLQP
jgi:hypothetical protein